MTDKQWPLSDSCLFCRYWQRESISRKDKVVGFVGGILASVLPHTSDYYCEKGITKRISSWKECTASEPKPCPKCGGTDIEGFEEKKQYEVFPTYYFKCSSCGRKRGAYNRAAALEFWSEIQPWLEDNSD